MATVKVKLRPSSVKGKAGVIYYQITRMCSFGDFLGDCRLTLSALTEQVITDYNSFLIQRGLVRNSVSFYMRVLRAIYNKAVRQKTHRTATPVY